MTNQHTTAKEMHLDSVAGTGGVRVAATVPVAAGSLSGGAKCCFRWDGGAAPTSGYRVFAPDKNGACPSWWVPDFSEIRYEGSPCPKNEAEARALWYASPMSHAWMIAASKQKTGASTASVASTDQEAAIRLHERSHKQKEAHSLIAHGLSSKA